MSSLFVKVRLRICTHFFCVMAILLAILQGHAVAEELNLTSLQHRPSWPATWANLVYIKWLKNELDDSFQNYLSKASFFGPNSPEVHSVIATIGLSLPERNVRLFLVNKELVKKHLLLGLEHPKAKKAVIDGVLNANKQTLVCSWLKEESTPSPRKLKC